MVNVSGVRCALNLLLFRCVAMVMIGVVRWIDDLNGVWWVRRWFYHVTSGCCTEVISTMILGSKGRVNEYSSRINSQ